jgi:AcrR family transcriptional regulator
MRAITEEQRRSRREAITDVVGSLLGAYEYDAITVAEIASASGVAKGAVFLLFASKEDIFLALMVREYRKWFERIELRLEASGGKPEPGRFAELFVDCFEAEPKLVKIVSIVPTVLEAGATLSGVIEFKRSLLRGFDSLAERLSLSAGIDRAAARKVLLQLYLALLGALSASRAPESVRNALARDRELSFFAVDFRSSFMEMAVAILRQLDSRRNVGSDPES